MIDKDKKLWHDIACYDLAECVPDMKKGVYTFIICTGADICNTGVFIIGHKDNLDNLDIKGEVYKVLDKNLNKIIDDLSVDIYIKMRSKIFIHDFRTWFDKTLNDRAYKAELFKGVYNVIKKNNYQYEKQNTFGSYWKHIWEWMITLISKGE